MLNALLQGHITQEEHNFQDCQNKKKGGGGGAKMTGCYSPSKITGRSISQNPLKIISKSSFQWPDFYMVIKQLAIQVVTGCRVSTTGRILRNRHQLGEIFSADSKKSVCGDSRARKDPTDMTAVCPCTGGSACSQLKAK